MESLNIPETWFWLETSIKVEVLEVGVTWVSARSRVLVFNVLKKITKRYSIVQKILGSWIGIRFIGDKKEVGLKMRFLLAGINLINCFVLSDNNRKN